MCNHKRFLQGLLALVAGSLLTGEVLAQSTPQFGNSTGTPYRSPLTSRSANRGFGNAGLSPGSSMGANLGSRLGGPTLNGGRRSTNYTANRRGQYGNTPARNSTPVLSPALNMLPGATNNFSGQYLLRTQPFEEIGRQEQNFGRQLGMMQQEINAGSASQRGYMSGDAFLPIRSGLTPTGHAVGFFNTGTYYP
ncbi:MAG: hypothetical protein ACK6D3_17250 [Planctomycetaceae bacterium]|jgi:hypothetical protein